MLIHGSVCNALNFQCNADLCRFCAAGQVAVVVAFAHAHPEQLDLVLVPCTAFDAACRRVGMGKGYYDRYLPGCRNAVALGVAFEAQRVPEAAADEQDWQLDGFVTERKVYRGTDEFEL